MALQRVVVTKKAQSALEFLTTYGWAFLVILIMIGALSYFGVLDPSRFLPDKCLFGAGLGSCVESQATATQARFKLINAIGGDIYIYGSNMTNIRGVTGTCDGYNSSTTVAINGGTAASIAASGTLWPSGQTAEFINTCAVAVGERVQATPVIIEYRKSGGTYLKKVEGDVAFKRSS